jgi:transcription antitermination protein NusB
MVGERRKAREAALQALYEIDLAGHASAQVTPRIIEENALTEEGAAFARELVEGVVQNREKIDEQIRHFASAWPLDQMAVVDRNILRLAIYELLHNNKVPVKVAINEAVELSKSFGADSSPRFINGVLSSVSNLATR